MELILRRIPADTQRDEILAFVEPGLDGGWFHKNGYVTSVRIISLKDMRTGTVEHHGLVNIEPDAAALRVIKKLRMTNFKGKSSGIREYVYRSWHNDRRNGEKQVSQDILNKRKGDRRRPMVLIHDTSRPVSQTSHKNTQ